MPLAEFTVSYLRMTFGDPRAFAKKYRAFTRAVLLAVNDDPGAEGTKAADEELSKAVHGWICLYAQLCGAGTPSGRIAALPAESAEFTVDMLREVGRSRVGVTSEMRAGQSV